MTCIACGTHLNVRLWGGLVLCPGCRVERNRESNRISRLIGPTEDGFLRATCWCETSTFVLVPIAEVKAGRTGTCGRPSCRESVAA